MPNIIKAIILGREAVGKTSILTKCVQGLFGNNHNTTVGVDYVPYQF